MVLLSGFDPAVGVDGCWVCGLGLRVYALRVDAVRVEGRRVTHSQTRVRFDPTLFCFSHQG
eukprot:943738-Rhodomonas_salina.1